MKPNNHNSNKKKTAPDANQPRSNLPASHSAALLSIVLPKASTSREEETWQQTSHDLDADERLARQLAEEEEIQYALTMSGRGNRKDVINTTINYDADEKLARQLAQEEEDLYFSNDNQPTFIRQQSANLINVVKKPTRKEYNPINFSNVVIHTKSSKKLAKQMSKKQHLNMVTTNNDIDTSESLSVARRMRAEPEPRYPHVYDALLDAKLTLSSLNNQKVYLPSTSSRKSYSDYEEITVKKMEKIDLIPQDKLITIADNFDPVGQHAFAGCKSLNPMQSLVFETAYKSNQNMLVAAPTGAGKTNVAMLAVLHELKSYYKPGTTELISKDVSEKFKIVYIAPMKSLATEQTENFNSRLKGIGIRTRELTGDMSLTESEMSQTHIIVTTPEKWDVVTRKSKGDVDLLSLVRLMIIDEVHLLQSDRGPVLEALVARTLRYVESSQRMTRIIGLSATLPNYIDISTFLRVNPYEGLFYFDNRFRPVPLTQTFIGVRPLDTNSQSRSMDKICYNLILQYVMQSKQVMIFVHARNSTQRVATKLREMIQLNNKMDLFEPDLEAFPEAAKLMTSSKNNMLRDLLNIGFGIHHAGMVRHDRLLVERLFRQGVLKVLVCTATLAWGVNFPAHAVIIRGTEIYDASAGKFVDVGLLDVMQIFGRAGRPQYDVDGHAIIMTALEKMDSYLKLLTNQTPIESNFIKHLTDNLNAEVVSGTVSSIEEGMEWLRYTYLNVRLSQNPLVYGCEHYEIESDPSLTAIRNRLIVNAARQLDEARMCRFNQDTGGLEATDLGRIASHFYINYETVTRYNEILNDQLEPHEILGLIGEAQEFQQIKYREEEANELDNLRRSCYLPIAGGVIETTKGKVSCLLQAYISRSYIESHSLISDLMYIAQNATRIGRGLFEYSLKRGWPTTSLNLLRMCKMLELQCWNFQSPLRHFDLPPQVIMKLEEANYPVEQLDEMSVTEVAKLVNFPDRMGVTVKGHIKQLPYVIVEGQIKPIKSNLLKLILTVQPYFDWNDRYHGKRRQSFWLWVVDEEITSQIYHSEHIKFNKEQVQKSQAQTLSINIPLVDDTLEDGSIGRRIPSEYTVFVISDDWNGCDYEYPIECCKITLPDELVAYTKVPHNLNQLPLSVVKSDQMVSIFRNSDDTAASSYLTCPTRPSSQQMNPVTPIQFENFNILQSQIFHPLYYNDKNLLVCGPTGSGKTLLADLAILRVFNTRAKATRCKSVYINPIDSLVQLKYQDWSNRFTTHLQKQVMVLNDHTMYDEALFDRSDIIVTSAEKFFIWMSKANFESNLLRIYLVVLDNLHLMSNRKGSDMELVVSKLNYMKVNNPKIILRYIGIANTIANAQDLACWLSVKKQGVYNFHPATSRPIQLEIHINSFPERHYSPRMATMNKPIFKAIKAHSPNDPVMIYVSSKKQCASTALDLISSLVHYNQTNDRQWLNMDHDTLNSLVQTVQDENLKLSLGFGIGILYPGLRQGDKKVVLELYIYNKIQVLICTTNYAWESDLRARMVIVKGTEHYDVDAGRFTDYEPVDVMQMLGKAGRPNFDATGTAILLIRDIHKEFYKKFLYEPFPVESNLMNLEKIVLRNFLGSSQTKVQSTNTAEHDISDMDTPPTQSVKPKEKVKKPSDRLIEAKQESMKKLSCTFLARRLGKNPSFYGINDGGPPEDFLSRYLDVSKFLYDDS